MNDKLSQILNKMDSRMFKYKLEKALETFKNESPAELKRRLSKVDTQELFNKLNEYDKKKLQELNLDIDSLRRKLQSTDMQKLISVLGKKDSEELMRKLRNMLR